MKIVPYKVQFKPERKDRNKKEYARPMPDKSKWIKIDKLQQNGRIIYHVKTHDRGEKNNSSWYYQVAFHIENPSPYELDELELHIDSTSFRNPNIKIKNDLFCPDEDKFTDRNLWYQRTEWKYEKNTWKVTSEYPVDCITTAGVFRVVALRNGQIVQEQDAPWIYVLPSSISVENYQAMLSDLINLHESLVRKDEATVGIGTTTTTITEKETERLNEEKKWLDELERAVKKIISLPSELQRKEYTKVPLRKVCRFDSRVMRDYIRYGVGGKTLGVTYVENYDTYENRIIKFFLQRIRQRYNNLQDNSKDIIEDVERAVEEEYKKRIMCKADIEKKKRKVMIPFRLGSVWEFYLSINIEKEQVTMSGHNPFSLGGKKFVRIRLETKARSEQLFYLKNLTRSLNENTGSRNFEVECTLLKKTVEENSKGTKIYEYTICNIVSINRERFNFGKEDISESNYATELQRLKENIRGKYEIINVSKKVAISDTEERAIKAEIRARLERKQENVMAIKKIKEVAKRLDNLLEEPWFDKVSKLTEVTDIRLTAKFRMNRYYAVVYDMVTKLKERYPLLTADLDVNAFGVDETQRVYEYWVFYKLLYQLQFLGFELKNAREVLVNRYKEFVYDALNSKKSDCSIYAERKLGNRVIEIIIGYEHAFRGSKLRTPDYYLCVKAGPDTTTDKKKLHWYFMDAKYKLFSKDNKDGRESYFDEIYKVAVSKYIIDMKKILGEVTDTISDIPINQYDNEIRGSYIIMADVVDHSDDSISELSLNNRLFGGKTSVFEKVQTADGNKKLEVDNNNGLPCHRYGAIHLAPNHDDELQSLLELIFEYLEADMDKLNGVSWNEERKKSNKHDNLRFCWRCGSSKAVKREEKITGKSKKYYDTCGDCSMFRVDNYCHNCEGSIIKHAINNFHLQDDSVNDSQWAFVCPHCGARVKEDITDEPDEMIEDIF